MRRIKLIVGICIILISLLGLINRYTLVFKLADYTPQQLLRLHITANSNSPADQLLKRRIRAALVQTGQDLLANITDISQAKQRIKNNLNYLTKVAQQEVYKAGENYKVKLKLGEFKFPMRSYGSLTLAAGNYQALQVTIGQGQGENWWCVLFPPLCFIDSVDKLSPQQLKKLKQQNANFDIKEVKFKFKLLEYLKNNPKLVKIKTKLAKAF